MNFETLLADFIRSGSQDTHDFYWDKHNKHLTVNKYTRSLTGWTVKIEYLPSYETNLDYTNEETIEISFEQLFVFVYSKALENTNVN
jgi:hypothetical protein